MPSRQKAITLVLGGARSGKSRFAQQLASAWSSVTFLATAEARDEEMRDRIERHRQDRPAGWMTVEEPVDLDGAVRLRSAGSGVLLIDCLTLYASNLMELEHDREAPIMERVDRLCQALQSAKSSVILVSNEVGYSLVPDHPRGRFFRDLQGRINQQVARLADNVVLMVAGIPLVVKGGIP